MDKIKENILVKNAPNFLVISCMILMATVNILRLFGCIDYNLYGLKDVFFASTLFLLSIIVYECASIKDKIKLFLIGALFGIILFVYQEFSVLLLVFLVNIIWSEMSTVRHSNVVLRNIVSIVFYSMFTLEIYSICALMNEEVYEQLIQNSIMIKFVDILLIVSLVLYIICENQREKESIETQIVKKKRYTEVTRLSIWCVLICAVILMSIVELSSEINANAITGNLFYLGKTMDGGYLLSQEVGYEMVYYAKKVETSVGGVLENLESYQLIPLETGFGFQKFLLYATKLVCQLFCGIYGVVLFSIIVMLLLIYEFLRYKKKD